MVLFRKRLIPHTQALTLSSRTRQPRHPSLLALQPGHLSFLTLRVGMPCVKLCVTIDTSPRTQERTQSVQKGMPTLEHGHDGALQNASHPSHSSPDPIVPYAPAKTPIAPRTPSRTPIVPHAPRGNAVREALRHNRYRATHSREDAERPERHAHAGAWARWCSSGRVSSLTLKP
ncbi:hypothetical protein SAMN05421724_0912 [Pseudomonas syringae]|nr:hypothetical protein SAMN05421724_0912 [Pseudomonas syringae]